MLNISKFLKGLAILNHVDQTKQADISVSNSATTNTKSTISIQQTSNRTLSIPNDNVTGELLVSSSVQTITNKIIDADLNTITNIENADIKTGAAIDATKIANGVVGNVEFQNLDGLSSPAVGTTQIQTITNKTIVVADNTITTASSGNLVATELNAALSELQTDIDTNATNLSNHIVDAVDAHDATAISVNPVGNLTSTEVQAALEELQSDIDNIGTFANQSLSNLTTTSINQSLLPQSVGKDLGTSLIPWAFAYTTQFSASDYGFFGGNVTIGANITQPDGVVTRNNILSDQSNSLYISSPNQASFTTRDINLFTGNVTVGGNNSGNISLRTGSVVSGVKGVFNLDSDFLFRKSNDVEVISSRIAKNVSLLAGGANEIVQPLVTILADYKSIIAKYSMNINGEKRTGTLYVAATATNVAISDVFVETVKTTVTFDAIIAGGEIRIRQSNVESGVVDITLDIMRMRE